MRDSRIDLSEFCCNMDSARSTTLVNCQRAKTGRFCRSEILTAQWSRFGRLDGHRRQKTRAAGRQIMPQFLRRKGARESGVDCIGFVRDSANPLANRHCDRPPAIKTGSAGRFCDGVSGLAARKSTWQPQVGLRRRTTGSLERRWGTRNETGPRDASGCETAGRTTAGQSR